VTSTKSSDDTVKLKTSAALEVLGEWCVRKGLATPEEIASCIRIQHAAESSGRPAPRLGEILVARGILTHHQVAEALAAQHKEIRTCPRCGIQINVTTRGDAAAFRCGRCHGPLTPPQGTPPLAAVDEDFILVSKDPLPAEVEEALKDPASRFGKYVLLQRLGQGGIGIVYKAWDTYLSQFVALKRLRTARPLSPQDTPNEHVQSLLKEARHAIRLRHPGIVSVFDVGRVGREYYVAMEYLEGETLADRIAASRGRGQPSPFYEDPRVTVGQLLEIAQALQYAHSRPAPIVHCDLKPANILIDREQRSHVLDFGLARNLELDKPERGEISGTPSYMAPEQASGEADKIDRRTDVYSFGAVLYEMLTGRPSFTGGTIEVLGKTIGDEPERPSDSLRASQLKTRREDLASRELPQVPPALEELCMKCLKKNRDDRPQSMDDVIAALEGSFQFNKPVPEVPPPTSLPSPSRPERSRRPKIAILIAALALILAVGSALVHSFLPAPAARESFEGREAEVYLAISRFQPALARMLAVQLRKEAQGTALEARASRLAEEATWVAQLQGRVSESLAARPVDLPILRTRHGAATAVRLLAADAAGLRIVEDGRTRGLAWENLEPEVLINVLQLALGKPEDADLLGLAIIARRNGLAEDADRLFARLRSTPLGPIAERYQVSSND
jgi:serine/threonine protein kinase